MIKDLTLSGIVVFNQKFFVLFLKENYPRFLMEGLISFHWLEPL